MLTTAKLHEIALRRFTYDPLTGILTSKAKGRQVGSLGDGYLKVYVGSGNKPAVHRIAWLLVHGTLPAQIDHINGDRQDNRLANLREVVGWSNQQNVRRPTVRNKLGVLGVSSSGYGRFFATITSKGKTVHLGTHDTAELAHAVYVKAKRELHAGNTL